MDDYGLIRNIYFSFNDNFLVILDGKFIIRLWNLFENKFKILDVEVISMNFSINKF